MIALDNRFLRRGGVVYDIYTQDYAFWTDYLRVFDRVRVLGRVRDVSVLPKGALRSCGPGVSFEALPHWSGPIEMARVWPRLRQRLRRLAATAEAALLRVPGVLGHMLAPLLRHRGLPYAVEVVADLRGGFPREPLFGCVYERLFERDLAFACRGASAASYVTEAYLQARFPSPTAIVTTTANCIRLPSGRIRPRGRTFSAPLRSVRLCHISGPSFSSGRKGQLELLRAVRRCRDAGLDVHVDFAGSGSQHAACIALAEHLGLGDACTFLGDLPNFQVYDDVLARADILALPSRAEGLPRAVLEAMACGVPVLATPVAGVPEVLPPDAWITTDPREIADRILWAASNPQWLTQSSERQLSVAKRYSQDVLGALRVAFYRSYRALLACS